MGGEAAMTAGERRLSDQDLSASCGINAKQGLRRRADRNFCVASEAAFSDLTGPPPRLLSDAK